MQRLVIAVHKNTDREFPAMEVLSITTLACCDKFGNVAGHNGVDSSTGNGFIGNSTPRIQTGIFHNSWEFNLLVSLISLLLWCYALLVLGSLVACMQDREQLIRARKMKDDRLEFVHKMIKIEVRNSHIRVSSCRRSTHRARSVR